MLQTLKSVKRNKAQGGVSRWALYHLLHTLQSHCNLLLSTSFFLLLRHLHLCHAVRACRKLKVTLIIPFMMHLGHSSSIPEHKPNSYIMVVVVVVCHEKSNSITNSYYASCTGNSFSSSSCELKQHTTACTAGCCSKYAAQARQLRQLLHHYRNLRPESRNACDHIFFPTARPATVSYPCLQSKQSSLPCIPFTIPDSLSGRQYSIPTGSKLFPVLWPAGYAFNYWIEPCSSGVCRPTGQGFPHIHRRLQPCIPY